MVRKIDRRKRFAQEYVVDLNGKRAAIAAGYAPASAEVQASQLLTDPKVRQWVDALMAERASKLGLKAEQVVERIKTSAFSNMADYVDDDGNLKPITSLPRHISAAIQKIKVDEYAGGTGDGKRRQVIRTTLELNDQLKAQDMLMRHLGAYNDKLKVTGLDDLAEILQNARKRAGK